MGGVVSWTTLMVTVKPQVDTLPQQSVAVQLTVVLPGWNTLPEGGLLPMVTFVQQVSVTETVKLTTTPAFVQVVTTMFDGQLITGGVVSTIDTIWLQVLVWPQASTSCHVRVTTVGQVPLVTVPITTRELADR